MHDGEAVLPLQHLLQGLNILALHVSISCCSVEYVHLASGCHCEFACSAQAKPADGRLSWLVEACVRELCGSNHATPLKLEVELNPFMEACDLLAIYSVCSDVPAFKRTEHMHVQLHDMRSMRLHTWEQCRHGGIAAGSLCSWAVPPPLCKLWRKVPILGCVYS